MTFSLFYDQRGECVLVECLQDLAVAGLHMAKGYVYRACYDSKIGEERKNMAQKVLGWVKSTYVANILIAGSFRLSLDSLWSTINAM